MFINRTYVKQLNGFYTTFFFFFFFDIKKKKKVIYEMLFEEVKEMLIFIAIIL